MNTTRQLIEQLEKLSGKKIFLKEEVTPIKRVDLIQKLQPLKTLTFPKITDIDIKNLVFTGSKKEIKEIYKALKKIGVQDYFDEPLDGLQGVWIIDTMYADDNDWILNENKKVLKEGFKANSGLSNVLVLYKKHPENFSIDPNIHKEIIESGIKGDDIFSFASLFKKDSFRIEDIGNGKLEGQIKWNYISDEDINRNLKKAQALKKFVSAMDEYYQEKNWPSKW